jgi:actin-related protein 5
VKAGFEARARARREKEREREEKEREEKKEEEQREMDLVGWSKKMKQEQAVCMRYFHMRILILCIRS